MPDIWLSDEEGNPYSLFVNLAEVWDSADELEKESIFPPDRLNLEDPVKRLEIVVALRKLGYTVESA